MSSGLDASAAGRGRLLASGVSIGLHAGVVILAVALTSRAVTRPPRLTWTSIEVVDTVAAPAQPAAAPAPAPVVAPPEASAAAHSRRSLPAPRAPKPPAATDVRTDLAVSYDDPDNFRAAHPSDAPSDGERGRPPGIAASVEHQIDTGVARLEMPAPSPVSLARPARPQHDYHKLHLTSVRQFAGQSIRVLLSIDATGAVSDVKIVQGIESHLDQRTIALTRAFKFDPALDEVGTPIASTSKWEILIVDEAKESIKGSLQRGFY